MRFNFSPWMIKSKMFTDRNNKVTRAFPQMQAELTHRDNTSLLTNREVHENLDGVLEAIRDACGKICMIPS